MRAVGSDPRLQVDARARIDMLMDSLDARYYTGRPRPLAIRYGWPAVVHLRIGEQRVKTHVHNLLSKLGVSSRIQVALYSSRARLLDQALDKPA